MTALAQPLSSGPSWEDQIVPTLRKRLESESAYLSNRLSATYHDGSALNPSTNPSPIIPFPSSPTPGPAGSAGLTAPFPSAGGRTRTKSTPLSGLAGTSTLTSSSGRQGYGDYEVAVPPLPDDETYGSTNSYDAYQRDGAVQQQQFSSTTMNGTYRMNGLDKADTWTSTSPLKSRIPTRPRSRSQAGSRSSSHSHTTSPPSQQPPLPIVPSGIPIPKRRVSSPSRDPSSYGGGRRSPDLSSSARVREGFIKNELPPFKMLPEEAMRIAERGHDIPDDTVEIDFGRTEQEDVVEEVESSGEKRKRSMTMRSGGGGSGLEAKPKTLRQDSVVSEGSGMVGSQSRLLRSDTGQSGIPRSITGGVGLGHPSSTIRKIPSGTGSVGKGRSASSRPKAGPSKPSPSTAARSASLNLLGSPASGTPSSASSSRLGIAAHLVPPDTTYTPPKGANWDEVFLPTVAKKLGMYETARASGGGEDDLVVEWDKDGTPVKWVTRSALSKLDASQGIYNGLSNDDFIANTSSSPPSSSFLPTFELSPNNPFNHNPVRPKRSGEDLRRTLSPLRTTMAHDTDFNAHHHHDHHYNDQAVPPSPAPFSSLAPVPPGRPQSSSTNSSPDSSRRPSTVRQPSHPGRPGQPGLSPRPSHMSLRTTTAAQLRAASNTPGQTVFAPGHYNDHSGGGSAYFDAAQGRYPPSSQAQSQMRTVEGSTRDKKGKRGHGDDVGKGCGCVIM